MQGKAAQSILFVTSATRCALERSAQTKTSGTQVFKVLA